MTSAKADFLGTETLVLVGYGAQGRAEAQNLRRSGVPFQLSLRKDGPSWHRAKGEGFQPLEPHPRLFEGANVALNLPDQDHAAFGESYLQKARRILFAHGFSTHYRLLPQREGGARHLLIAPKGAASGLMEYYGSPQALPCILGSATPTSKEDREFAEAYALAIGCHPKGLIWASFKDETECDLFSEQALLCGGVSSLLRRTYEVMIEAGYHPETAYFESLFELKLIVDLIWKEGITGMRNRISPTARYGDITRGDRLIDESVKERMREILKEVQSGEFAKEFLSNISSQTFSKSQTDQANHPIEKIGQKIRERMKDEP